MRMHVDDAKRRLCPYSNNYCCAGQCMAWKTLPGDLVNNSGYCILIASAADTLEKKAES